MKRSLTHKAPSASQLRAWHPAGVNDAGRSDLLVSRYIFPLRRALESVVEHFLEYRQLDGSLPRAYHCA